MLSQLGSYLLTDSPKWVKYDCSCALPSQTSVQNGQDFHHWSIAPFFVRSCHWTVREPLKIYSVYFPMQFTRIWYVECGFKANSVCVVVVKSLSIAASVSWFVVRGSCSCRSSCLFLRAWGTIYDGIYVCALALYRTLYISGGIMNGPSLTVCIVCAVRRYLYT